MECFVLSMNQFSIKHSKCPHCGDSNFIKKGYFYKKISKTYIPRYRCTNCRKSFSTRTLSLTFQQKRPDFNKFIFLSLVSGVSMRKTAANLNCSYRTVYKKFLWMANIADKEHAMQKFSTDEIQFDEMESIEHTKLKPLTICLAVSNDYKILGARVGKTPAKGHLADLSIKKYGFRSNESSEKMIHLLSNLKKQLLVSPKLLKSDAKLSYKMIANELFPDTHHQQFVSRNHKDKKREMKYHSKEKRIFDPLFALNQRCAKLRDHIKRLTRRSWCTTKRPDHLEKHLMLYIARNNNYKLF